MLRRITCYFSLFAFLVQIFHLSFIGLLIAQSTPVFAQDEPLVMPNVFNGVSVPTYDHSSGTANFGGDVNVGRGELFGLDADRANSSNHFDANQAYQKEDRLSESADTLKNRINRNTVGSESDYDVKAWNTLKGSMDNQEKLNSDDTLMVDSDNILRDLADNLDDPNSDFFSACVTETNTHSVSREYIGKTEYQCSEPDRTNLNHCEIKRHVDYPIIKTGGTGTLHVIDDYTFDLIIGEEVNNGFKGGACTLFPFYVEVYIRDDVEIASATLAEMWVDDIVEVKLNSEVIHTLYWQGKNSMPAYSNEYGCEYSKSRHYYPNTNVTAKLNRAMKSNGGKVRFHMLLGVSDGGEGKGRVRIRTKNKVTPTEHIEQSPVGCAAQVGYVQPADTCEVFGTVDDEIYINPQCDNPLTFGNGQVGAMCKFDGWQCVETGLFDSDYDRYVSALPITLPGRTSNPKVCTKVNAVGYSCDPLPTQEICGRPNWPESDEVVCTSFKEFNDQIPDRCEPFRDNPDCSLISTEANFVDPNTGRAYVSESTYECNTYTDADYEYITEEELCTGEMKCVGGDCRFSPEEENEDFEEAMAVFKMLEDIKQNMQCENPDDISTCRVFNGEANYCGVEKTGMGFNCCTLSAGQTNMFDYMKGIMHKYSMEQSSIAIADSAQLLIDQGVNNPWGMWADKYPTPVTDTVNYVTESFSNSYDHIMGNTTGEVATSSGSESMFDLGLEKGFEEIKQQVYQAVYEILPEGIKDVIFTQATDSAGAAIPGVMEINPAIQGAFQAVMWAYAAYQITKLAITILSECDDSEMQMGMKIERGQCIYDSKSCYKDTPFGCFIERKYYCCYPSPLGRIIMEQAAPQLGIEMDPKGGSCEGMTLEQMSNLDWDQIDLTEWENLVMATGVAVEHNDLNLDTLSTQPWMSNASERLDPVTLNQERFEKSNIADNLKETHDAATADNLDCSVYPRPPACESSLSLMENK
ncbi:conjugal transfer protein TraN (plasmid) [Vibrio scophthalmi]|uniref:conjugal transfer protein TraN n=1 Tax=Vibrio scophthalmi TaxID=45658 RepID=UPI003EBAAB4E